MTKSELISYVTAELTASCSLPFSPPAVEISRIIDLESRWMYREYRDSLDARWYIIDKSLFKTAEWKRTRTFKLPNCVMGINTIYELTSGQRVFGINDPDMHFDRLMSADMYLTPLSSDQIMYRTIQWSFWDLARQFNLREVLFKFNINTKNINILGRDLQESLFVTTMNAIPEEDLYEDPIFIKWVIAKSKISLARILGTFDYSLIGNVKINYADIRSEGTSEIEELKEKIKGDNMPDWFFTFN
jgi:hypothetical protein